MMQRDGQRRFIQSPKCCEAKFSLGAGIDEDNRDPRGFNTAIDFRHGSKAHMPAPGQMTFGQLQIKYRGCAACRRDQPDRPRLRIRRQPGAQGIGHGHGCGKPDALGAWRQHRQTRQAKRQLITALGAGQSVDFINDDASEACEDLLRIGQ